MAFPFSLIFKRTLTWRMTSSQCTAPSTRRPACLDPPPPGTDVGYHGQPVGEDEKRGLRGLDGHKRRLQDGNAKNSGRLAGHPDRQNRPACRTAGRRSDCSPAWPCSGVRSGLSWRTPYTKAAHCWPRYSPWRASKVAGLTWIDERTFAWLGFISGHPRRRRRPGRLGVGCDKTGCPDDSHTEVTWSREASILHDRT